MSQSTEAKDLLFSGLLEASNYLRKLGFNLITRSTNLNFDKIVSSDISTENDIDNAIAKIAVICHLSRKSLDSVEKELRHVLRDYKQTLKRQSRGQGETNMGTCDWYRIEFDNLVLKISKKINMSHYISAQISLKRLNKSIVNKYISSYNKIYGMKTGKTDISSLNALKKDSKVSKRSPGNGKEQKEVSPEQNDDLKNKVEITNNVDICEVVGNKNISKESEKNTNVTPTKKGKSTPEVETASNKKIETKDKCRRNSKELPGTSKDKMVRKRKSISEGQEDKEKEISKEKIKDTNNLMEDSKKESEFLEQEDEETERSLGKLTCTGGMDTIRIRCIDINKLIDKAKALDCKLSFKSNKQKSNVDDKTVIKKKTNMNAKSGINKTTKVDTKSEMNRKSDDDAQNILAKTSDVVAKNEIKKKNKAERRFGFGIAKPFSIKVIRMHNNLQIYKDEFNLKKIVYKNEEIFNLIESVPKGNDTDKSSKSENKEQQEDIDAGTNSIHSQDLEADSVQSQDIVLKYWESDDENRIDSEGVACLQEAVLHVDEEERKEVAQECAKDVLLKYSDSEEKIPKGVTQLKVVMNDNSSSDETVKLSLRLPSLSPTSRRRSSQSSLSSCSSTERPKIIKKMGRSSAKPGNNGSQSSETQDSDKDIDGLTNLNSLNRTTMRGKPDSTSKTDKIKEKGKKKKDKLIVLEADSNSSDDEPSETEGNEFEGVPEAVVQSNGNDGVTTFAKTDLLGECDSTNNEEISEKEENNMDGTSDEDNVKKRRRKLLAITSDSEVDTTRKTDADVKLSDFEDSDEESLEPVKKNKRKKKSVDSSDASGDSSNDSSKKKRRRIKQVDDSDLSGSGSEAEGRRHGRKNIRKVMGKGQLEEATIKAAREERGRLARIAERQKLYNNLEFDESGKPDEVVLDKVVLDFDPETKEPLIQVDTGLVKKLKPHQANGIKFMWDACFESVKRIKKDKGSGCILAHCMGLGKTLQVISLTHTLLTHAELTGVRRVLVVCPLSTVLNWVNEINMWLEHAETDTEVDIYELSRYKQNVERAMQLKHWYEGGGICVLGYEMFRNLSAENSKKYRKKMLKSFQESLVDPGPDLVVCDEGHLLKNQKTSLSQSMNRIKTRRRIVLTGTPLQNNLKEYYCMVTFVKPNLLGKYNEYLNRFVNPITNGQYTDSTDHDIKIMKRRSHVLHKMLDGAVQRRDYGVLAPFLPPKHEYVVFITLSDIQITLYQHYLDKYSRRPLPGKSSGFLFPDFQSLQRIWTHPLVLKYNSERYEIMQQKKREREEEDDSEGSLVDFIDDESTPDESSSDDSTDLSDVSDDSRKKAKKKKAAKKSKNKESKASARRGTRANPGEISDEVLTLPEEKYENPTEWWIKLVNEEELEDMRNSHKLVLLFDILRQCEAIGDKVLVFSQSLYSLDLIEHYLEKIDEATQEGRVDEKLGGHVGSWSPGVDYFRLDGSTSCENRSLWCKNFNREDNPRARLFLISTRAGGLGINLVAANRVVIFDVSWNPSHDVQSIFRVYRFGQKKPCYVYRFLAMGTMEEKIYERQVTKQAISKRVIDEQQIDRHYAENDLAELYKFEPRPPEPRELPPLPKDRLFAEMLKDREKQIYKYHEHDSLLENKEEETLTEEERKAAWEDFENEKNRPPPAPFPTMWPMHNGMTANLMAQQQQQLAYAAVAAVLRKDVPNINDQQIREMVPLIYNANPALMQKMGDIYKYGMMNPGMMSSVMGGGGGVGGVGGVGLGSTGLGSSSGLQYEPPWQRQQQQQQQMRLQQLMQQQQQQLGQKYYAGGLGSRDPVAMALQQQFARELGETARGRPRGRPPLQPRVPLPADAAALTTDVVDLDSD